MYLLYYRARSHTKTTRNTGPMYNTKRSFPFLCMVHFPGHCLLFVSRKREVKSHVSRDISIVSGSSLGIDGEGSAKGFGE